MQAKIKQLKIISKIKKGSLRFGDIKFILL